jgi:hypothetical protein
MIIQVSAEDMERAVYWLPWADLRSWLRDECERFNTDPLVTSQRHFVELSYQWEYERFLLTYRSSRAGSLRHVPGSFP